MKAGKNYPWRRSSDLPRIGMAPEVGLEPTTSRLTAARSTIELLWTPRDEYSTNGGAIRQWRNSANCDASVMGGRAGSPLPAAKGVWRRLLCQCPTAGSGVPALSFPGITDAVRPIHPPNSPRILRPFAAQWSGCSICSPPIRFPGRAWAGSPPPAAWSRRRSSCPSARRPALRRWTRASCARWALKFFWATPTI